MKKLLFLLILVYISLNAQTYTEQWREIAKLENSRLPKSALAKVELIYKKAEEENNSTQLIKAIIHKNRYISTLSKKGVKASIENMEKEITKITHPASKLLLKSMLAEMYEKDTPLYYKDEADESITKGLDRASKLYLESLGEEAKSISIQEYKSILTEGNNTEGLRPTLYDFLAFRALKHFSNSRNYLRNPIYNFYIKDKEAFASISSFINHEFQAQNKNSYKYKALLIYQELLRFHKSTKDAKALQHINFERINFVYRNFVGDKKEQYYLDALTSLESQHANSEALYYLAKYYLKKDDYRKAIGYAKRGIENKDKYISQECLIIKNKIESKYLKLYTEKVYLPNENILSKISYRNMDKIFVKVIKLKDKEIEKLPHIDIDGLDKYLLKLDTFREFNLTLPATDDYKEHSTEISLGNYGFGDYLFLISKDREFNKFSKSFSAVSRIAYFHKNSKLMIVDRESGKPLEGVKAELYLSKYNRKTDEHRKELISTKISDKDGIVHLPVIEYEYDIHLKYGDDSLNFARGTSYDREYDDNNIRKTLHFFTDRAVYRPSQTIYFKALAVAVGKENKILPNEEIEVRLYNANRQKIKTKKFKTNEFGTINGFFILPKGGRLGRMSLSSNLGGNKNFRVEEYKRAKFDISFLQLDKSYRVGDSISVEGIVKAYAGNGLDGATVKYSIKRAVSFPWTEKSLNNYIPYESSSIEIDMGEVKTDKDGKFRINFDALVDKSISADKKPNFKYTLSVDVTDTTGETHSSSKSINLGFVAMDISMIIDKEIDVESNISLGLESTNLDGKFEPTQGRVVIEKYKEREKLYRDRYWSTDDIDMFVYNAKEFSKLFGKYKPINRSPRAKEIVKTLNFDTKKSKKMALGKLLQGEYLLTLYTKDRYGTEVQKSKRVILYDLNSSKPPYQTPLWDKVDKKEYRVDSTATLYIKSSYPSSFVLLYIERDGKIVKQKWIKLSQLDKELIKIKRGDRGDIFYYLNMVKNNREYNSFKRIRVPWRKKLKVEYRSFRDRLRPNQQEQWSIKISGIDKERVVAEMVATMYDASLDKIVKHDFNLHNLFKENSGSMYRNRWDAKTFSLSEQSMYWRVNSSNIERVFSHLNRFNNYHRRNFSSPFVQPQRAIAMTDSTSSSDSELDIDYEYNNCTNFLINDTQSELGGDIEGISFFGNSKSKPISVRKNLQETMFFKPNLKTDKDGNIIIDFKTNEALTRWRFLAFAHTKELDNIVTSKEIVTQKELMVVTNLPRFFREGDTITLSARVVNMSQKDLKGICQLKLQNPKNGFNIYKDHNFTKQISLKKGASTKVDFKIKIPQIDSVSTLQHTIIVKTEQYSDAEQVIKPILSNREFVTESKAFSLKANETKSFTLNSLKENNSTTLKNHKLTLEFSSNPIWYAIKSLPYLMEYPHECSEQLFNRYFANTLASYIVNSSPKIKKIFDSWKSKKELKSALRENQELKAILLEETPWVLDAQSEEKQLQNLSLLFDMHKLAKERESVLLKLSARQDRDNGGWAWFGGSNENWYITQYIVEGFGKLEKLGIKQKNQKIIKKAIAYIDRKMLTRYGILSKIEKNNLNSIIIHYLYARSFFTLPIKNKYKEAYNYYIKLAEKYWMDKGLYEQGMIALTLYREGKIDIAKAIVKSLKERALVDDEVGMYFKYNQGFYWNQMPIETHSLMIEVFDTITHDKKSVELLKIWLLKNRQTTHWKTTKATASAIYALLLGDSSLSNDRLVDISFDTEVEYQPILKEAKALAQKGSGYFKASFDKFDKNMATLNVTNPNSNIAWGAIYWQYFEELQKIKSFKETPLKVDKKLYLIKGDSSTLIDSQSILNIGDKIKVKITVSTDKYMEYIMIKDNRASAFEPINILSQYRWKDGLGYYESTKDNATYFFLDYLRKGTYIFEYPLFVTHKGSFANGITTIESMYAPEFKSHSKGERINVK